MLNPDTKHLPFAKDEEKQRVRQLLREKATYMASVTKVKKEEQLETAGPTLPQLPEIPDDDDDEVQVKEPENPAKKQEFSAQMLLNGLVMCVLPVCLRCQKRLY